MTTTAFCNTDDEIYGHPLVYSQEDETFMCPVCSKIYQNRNRALAHLEKRNCAKALQRFRSTLTEKVMLDTYCQLMAILNVQIPITLALFRVSRTYISLANFFSYCADNKVANPQQYAEFCVMQNPNSGSLPLARMLVMGCSDSILKKYRRFLQRNPDFILSEQFYHANATRLQQDMSFIIRSVERADISLDYLLEYIDMERLMKISTSAEQIAFQHLLDYLEKNEHTRR